eukprot:CAMPEP_0194520820 /NCGR_PEP_ID=MMETSP0253-20130528/54947_1 /TAXON_ID=2966 /ORGANISM="Noctiluca scintillans" /LENGTH=71 /DNA_ID=CAMNT_0039365105 /DNA_START=59 /DNA_END=271 /DNA_ORIENTATION=+
MNLKCADTLEPRPKMTDRRGKVDGEDHQVHGTSTCSALPLFRATHWSHCPTLQQESVLMEQLSIDRPADMW